MIAIVISAVALLAMYSVFNSQHQVSIQNEDKLEMATTVNSSLNLLVNNARMAGYGIRYTSTPRYDYAVSPFNNFAATGGTASSNFIGASQLKDPLVAQIKTGTDGVLLLHTDNVCDVGSYVDNAVTVGSANGTATVCEPNCFTIGTDAFAVDDILLVIGNLGGVFIKLTSVTINQGTSAMCSGGTTNIGYTGIDELNFWGRPTLGAPGVNQELYRLQTAYLYYVNTSNQLARLPIDTSFAPEVIAEGLEDMQIQYDLMNGCAGGWTCGTCRSCNALATFSPSTILQEIRGVRAAVVLRSLREDRSTFLNRGAPIALFDAPGGGGPDSYRRRVASQMVRVKNLEFQDF